jgi:DNA-binding transcriptional LysR family regulator
MELRQLRLFVVLAQELNFRRAADKAHIAQPALTRHIQNLEALLGVRLFERTKRKVELTEAGKLLLGELQPVLRQLDHALLTVKQQGSQGDLRVGYVSPALYSAMPELVRQFKARHPHVRVEMQELHSPEQVSALLGGNLDLGFIGQHSVVQGLDFTPLAKYAYILALPEAHPLATQKKVELEHLQGLTLITPSTQEPLHQQIVGRLEAAGGRVNIQEALSVDAVLNFVAAGMGVAFVPELVKAMRRSGLVYKTMKAGLPVLELGIATHTGEPSKLVEQFLELARK